jgi:hypothetical protein
MYLVFIPIDTGADFYLFFWSDPRLHCPHPVVEGVDIDAPANQN